MPMCALGEAPLAVLHAHAATANTRQAVRLSPAPRAIDELDEEMLARVADYIDAAAKLTWTIQWRKVALCKEAPHRDPFAWHVADFEVQLLRCAAISDFSGQWQLQQACTQCCELIVRLHCKAFQAQADMVHPCPRNNPGIDEKTNCHFPAHTRLEAAA
jgi:hypothetical protein